MKTWKDWPKAGGWGHETSLSRVLSLGKRLGEVQIRMGRSKQYGSKQRKQRKNTITQELLHL